MPHPDRAAASSLKVCFLSRARYAQPLDPTAARKFLALRTLGEMHVIGFAGGLRPLCFTQHARFYLLPDLPSVLLRYAVMATAGFLVAFWVVARHDVGVVVAQSPYEGALAAVLKRAAAITGRRVVLIVESHGDFEESPFLQRSVPLARVARPLLRGAARFGLRAADLLRAVSGTTRRQLEEWTAGRSVHVFPAWTDLELFREPRAARDRTTQEVLFAGGIAPQKGVHHLIAAFDALAPAFPGARLVIAGAVLNRRYAASLRQEVGRRGLAGRVRFTAHLPQQLLATRMREAAVLALPSLSEGLPRVVLEAMAAGCPVVATRVGGIPEVIEDGRTGLLVPPGDEGSLSDALRRLLARPEDAAAMGQRARASAAALFSPDRYLRGYSELFSRALELQRVGSREAVDGR
jgi:glycosyltransferase involved in cell wall biosynthesis